jgi:hypothetical protein
VKNKMNEKNKNNDDILIEEFCPVGSSCDCTGLIPAGGELTDEEFENYKNIYTFSAPPVPDKKISK